MGTSEVTGTGVLSSIRLYLEKKSLPLPFFLDVRENCVGRSSGRVWSPISGKLLIGFTKYFHSELRSWGR